MKHIASILIGIILLSACGNRNSGNSTSNGGDNFSEAFEAPANADEWIGYYSFYEFLPPNINMGYDLIVYKEKEEYFAKVVIDGFQTMTRLRTKLQIDGNRASFVFDKYLPDNMFEPYKVGDVLLTLERNDTIILTTWGKKTPMDKENEEDGKVYFTLLSTPVYDAGWCELENMAMPQINTEIIKGDYAKQYDGEIRELYNRLKKDHDEFYAGYNGSGHGPEASYMRAVTGDILSIIITFDVSGFSAGSNQYKSYHLNIKTGQPVSSDELIDIAGLTPEDVAAAVEAANNRAVINSVNYNKYKAYYTEGVIEYPDANHYRNLTMYLGEEGLVVYVWVTNLPFENGEYFMPFLPAQWRNAKVSNITMSEAVDILAKRLNDRTLKYLLGEENESETIDGEKTHYIRAYHESPDGESIATKGHFYIGRQSGKIYIEDIILGDGIVLYDDYLKKYEHD